MPSPHRPGILAPHDLVMVVRKRRAPSGDDAAVYLTLSRAMFVRDLEAVTGFDRLRLGCSLNRLKSRGMVRTLQFGNRAIAVRKTPVPRAESSLVLEAFLMNAILCLKDEGWVIDSWQAAKPVLRDRFGRRAAVAVYPFGIRAASVRRLMKKLRESTAPDVLFIFLPAQPRFSIPSGTKPEVYVRLVEVRSVGHGP